MYNLARFTTNIFRRYKILTPIRFSSYKITASSNATKNVNKPVEKVDEDQDQQDAPIKYMQSPASKWRAESSRTGVIVQRLWYEPYVILVSITIFMVYFCILREENHIDRELERSLYSRIAGLEEHQLKVSLEHNRELGLDTADIEARLKDLGQ